MAYRPLNPPISVSTPLPKVGADDLFYPGNEFIALVYINSGFAVSGSF